jgi:hypothetical protein
VVVGSECGHIHRGLVYSTPSGHRLVVSRMFLAPSIEYALEICDFSLGFPLPW